MIDGAFKDGRAIKGGRLSRDRLSEREKARLISAIVLDRRPLPPFFAHELVSLIHAVSRELSLSSSRNFSAEFHRLAALAKEATEDRESEGEVA